MLDHEQSVPAVAQIVHHADEPANIARVETDARLVHDEKRVHQRSAETGGEIHALDLAATERARRAIEREITNSDFTQIIKTCANFIAQHLSGFVRR